MFSNISAMYLNMADFLYLATNFEFIMRMTIKRLKLMNLPLHKAEKLKSL